MAATRFAFRLRFDDRSAFPRNRGARYAGIAGAIVFHTVLIGALLQSAPVRRSLAHAAPLMVRLIAPTPPPQALPPPPKLPRAPKPVAMETPRPPEPPRIAPPPVADALAISPITLPPAPPPPPATPVAELQIAPEPPPIIPPRFNADYLQNPAPVYPALARRMHEQGRVLIRVLVGADGIPEKIELKTSSGFARLDHSALETIRGWKFAPARQGERKIAAWVVVPITFSLDG
jgi:periplasmic protein TonB